MNTSSQIQAEPLVQTGPAETSPKGNPLREVSEDTQDPAEVRPLQRAVLPDTSGRAPERTNHVLGRRLWPWAMVLSVNPAVLLVTSMQSHEMAS